jgi:hypothetical protein
MLELGVACRDLHGLRASAAQDHLEPYTEIS